MRKIFHLVLQGSVIDKQITIERICSEEIRATLPVTGHNYSMIYHCGVYVNPDSMRFRLCVFISDSNGDAFAGSNALERSMKMCIVGVSQLLSVYCLDNGLKSFTVHCKREHW